MSNLFSSAKKIHVRRDKGIVAKCPTLGILDEGYSRVLCALP